METIEIFVLVDSNGDYAVGKCDESVKDNYESDIGSIGIATRMVKVVLTVPLPQPIVMTGTVPAESTEGATLSVA